MRPPAAVIATIVASALFAGGCTGDREPSPSAADARRGTTSIPVGVTGAVDLRRLVVTDGPAGFELLPSPPYGAVDLVRLLGEFSDAPAQDETILEDAGFKAGYTRGWQRDDPRAYLGVFVFEFVDEAGARFARESFAAQNVAEKGATRFAVDGIADAIGESYTRLVDGQPPERVHLVSFIRGPRLYQVDGRFDDETTTVDTTVAFATTESALAA